MNKGTVEIDKTTAMSNFSPTLLLRNASESESQPITYPGHNANGTNKKSPARTLHTSIAVKFMGSRARLTPAASS